MRPLERVHIFGAAGCGSTTLGRALARRLEYQHLDTDDVYWLPSDPPYQARRPVPDRVRALEDATRWTRCWVLSGSLIAWGDALVPSFDLVVFLHVPREIRMARLRKRERERFGAEIDPGGSMYHRHRTFLGWAAGYDTGMGGRTLETDANWLAQLTCSVLPITGESSTLHQVDAILSFWARARS